MGPSAEQLAGLNVALNEANLLGLELDLIRRAAALELSVLTLREEGHAEIELWLFPVGRVAAALIGDGGHIERVRIEDLGDLVRSFGGGAIYGWNFFDPPKANLAALEDQRSLDFRSGAGDLAHTVRLILENRQRTLEVCLWFDEMEIRDRSGREIRVDAVIAEGKAWWDALFLADARTSRSGVRPLKK